MIIVKLMGGLGNQMFQYAAGRALTENLNTQLKIDTSFLIDKSYKQDFTFRDFELSCFNIKESIITKNELDRFVRRSEFLNKIRISTFNKFFLHNKISIPKIIEYVGTEFNQDILLLSNNTLLVGYWQSEKYFAEHHESVKQQFTFKTDTSAENDKILARINACNAVSIHIRRGDYAGNSIINSIHGLLGKAYYDKSIDLISSMVTNPVFFFFSDDIAWVKSTFHEVIERYSTYFIDHNKDEKSYEDMRLMSACKHNIIANSSFSWWGAWLNKNPEKIVISPKSWFNNPSIDTRDLIPEGWIRL